MATPQDIIKAMVSGLHQQHLKPLGFRKSGTTWIRPGEWTQVINVQLSKWNSSTEAQFTVNLGISFEELHAASEGLPLKGALKEYDCDVRTRIGQQFPGKQDKWWQVTKTTDPDQLADEVFARIDQFGLPWFDRLGDYSAVAGEFLDRKIPFMAALAYHLGGDAGSAETAMRQAEEESNQHFMPKLKRLATTHGIPING
ncbi:hypothetical protein HNR46_003729 [Haloferula luteola]|uniref:DUF4304 domain-containing protein n=1 Tax=Haloferula luteola TaxID=595692 RepID=A0A840VFT8_9BACT|nr:DUF4304 domain-containing protein [Haloferula luteola]MBB5353468.1 hypothetical protein [Haloferula luteola]